MEVILRRHVDHLGDRGDVVEVANGYARNYLLPRKLALESTGGNRRHVERERKIVEAHEAEEKMAAEALGTRLTALECEFSRRVGETDTLYGSVTTGDITVWLSEQGFDIERKRLQLAEPIKQLGEYVVPVRLHREVTIDFKVRVVKEGAGEAAAPAAVPAE